MPTLQKIIAHKGEFKVFGGVPAEARIHFKITRDGSDDRSVVDVQRVHPAQAAVQFESARQIHGGPQGDLILRVGCFVERIVDVHLARPDVQVFLEIIIAEVQPPPGKRLVIAA